MTCVPAGDTRWRLVHFWQGGVGENLPFLRLFFVNQEFPL